jgi:RNA polymerase sigma-70 factor (ECF subfamily)
MNRLQDREYLQRAKALDPEALEEIYDQYSPGLYAYSARLLGDSDLAEDCMAEVFSRFLKALYAGQGPQDFLQAYLYRMAHNWITDFYRRGPAEPVPLDDDLRAEDQIRPEKQVETHLEKEQVRAALRQLTPDQRQVIVLRFFHDWGVEEVARTIEKPAGAVKALQHRALAALRRLLDQGKEENTYGLE